MVVTINSNTIVMTYSYYNMCLHSVCQCTMAYSRPWVNIIKYSVFRQPLFMIPTMTGGISRYHT